MIRFRKRIVKSRRSRGGKVGRLQRPVRVVRHATRQADARLKLEFSTRPSTRPCHSLVKVTILLLLCKPADVNELLRVNPPPPPTLPLFLGNYSDKTGSQAAHPAHAPPHRPQRRFRVPHSTYYPTSAVILASSPSTFRSCSVCLTFLVSTPTATVGASNSLILARNSSISRS